MTAPKTVNPRGSLCQLRKSFAAEYVEISSNEYYKDDDWSKPLEVELDESVLWETKSLACIDFFDKVFPAPAPLVHTEAQEDERSDWEEVLAYDKVFQSVD